MDYLCGSRYFSFLHFRAGYWQVSQCQRRVQITYCLYCRSPRFVPLKLYALWFYRQPHHVSQIYRCLGDLHNDYLLFLAGIIIPSTTVECHLQKSWIGFERSKQYIWTFKPPKCQFLKHQVKYLSRIVYFKNIQNDPDTSKIVKLWLVPKNIKTVY